jgi:hypothetical protein
MHLKRSQVAKPDEGVRPLLNLPGNKTVLYLRTWYQYLTINGLTPLFGQNSTNLGADDTLNLSQPRYDEVKTRD